MTTNGNVDAVGIISNGTVVGGSMAVTGSLSIVDQPLIIRIP